MSETPTTGLTEEEKRAVEALSGSLFGGLSALLNYETRKALLSLIDRLMAGSNELRDALRKLAIKATWYDQRSCLVCNSSWDVDFPKPDLAKENHTPGCLAQPLPAPPTDQGETG